MKLASSNPLDDPLIDPRYLSHEDDVSTLISGNNLIDAILNVIIKANRKKISGIQLVKRLLNTAAMKKLGASLYEKSFPGCEHHTFDSADYWECYVRHLTMTSYHPAGTCRMGDVVDQSFRSAFSTIRIFNSQSFFVNIFCSNLCCRVFNTKNLYIADGSILPRLPSGNINAAVMMLAKKASRLLQRLADRSKTCTKFTGYLVALYGIDKANLNTDRLCLRMRTVEDCKYG